MSDTPRPTAVVDMKKATPIMTIIAALLLGGGAGGGLSILGGNEAEQAARVAAVTECRNIVERQADDAEKARVLEWSNHRREEESRYASKTDVTAMSVKLDMVMTRLDEIRSDLRDRRRIRSSP